MWLCHVQGFSLELTLSAVVSRLASPTRWHVVDERVADGSGSFFRARPGNAVHFIGQDYVTWPQPTAEEVGCAPRKNMK